MFLSKITYPFLHSVINFRQQVLNFCMARGQRYRYQQNPPMKLFGIYNRIYCINETQTCKQEYASARDIDPCRGLQEREKYRKAQYVKHCVCFVYLQSSLHENVVFSVCARMGNAAKIKFIMWNSISG